MGKKENEKAVADSFKGGNADKDWNSRPNKGTPIDKVITKDKR